MKNIIRRLLIGIVISMVTTTWAEVGTCQPRAGDSAPIFSLSDTKGESHDLSQMKKQIMHILYFFDAASRPSQEGLLQINKLAGKYSEADMTVWGITTSPKVSIDQFIEMAEPQFPILMDTHNVSDLYQARMILPTICIIGPDLKILDFFQGGGKTTEIMLIRLAERQMQRRQPLLAKAISDEVVKQNPANIKARVVKGYVAINEGDYKNAEDIFQYLTTQEGEGEVLGQEGCLCKQRRV
jgi:peroxiredoxin